MTRLILGLAGLTRGEAIGLVHQLGPHVYAAKAHDMVDEYGPAIVTDLRKAGAKKVWTDLKLDDVPKTVKRRAAALFNAGASIISVHAGGEIDMMMAAKEGAPDAMILGITILTSLAEEQVQLLTGQSVKAAVLYRARLAKLAGIDGVVCSPQEVGMLNKRPELRGLKFVVPGSRSVGKAAGDQKRIATPKEAIRDGATYLVVESQVIDAPDPLAELQHIEEEIAA